MVCEEKDGDGNEIPLGKMMKILKSQGAKKKLKRHTMKEPESEFDILGVVREINLDNMKSKQGIEIWEIAKDDDLPESQRMTTENGNVEVSVSHKRKETNGIAMLNVHTPKRKRSVSTQKSPANSIKGQSESRVISYSCSNKMDKKKSSSMESQDLLVSHLPTIKSMLNKVSNESKASIAVVNNPEVNS